MQWEDFEKRKPIWRKLCGMEMYRASFVIRATFNALPSPININHWYGENPKCRLCPSSASLKHILVGCKTSLSQGCCTRQHSQVQVLATSPETRWISINALLPPPNPISTLLFIKVSATTSRALTSKQHPGQLGMCGYSTHSKISI